MTTPDQLATNTHKLIGYADHLAAMADRRTELLAEFAQCVASVEEAHRRAELALEPLKRLQKIDTAIFELDAAAATLIEQCVAMLAAFDRG